MSDGYNPLEPVADAVLVATSLFLELGIKSICNLTILTSKAIGQIVNYLFEDKPKYESFNYETEVATTNNLFNLQDKVKECTNINYLPTKEYSFMELENVNFEGLPSRANYTSNKPPKNLFSTLEAYVGVNEHGKIQKIDFYKEGSLLVAGMSRWGKTSLILSMFTSLVETYPKEYLRIVLADFKGIDLVHLSKSNNVISCVENIEGFNKMLDWVEEQISKRKEYFQESKIQNIKAWNTKFNNIMQPVVIIIDEIAVMFNSFNDKKYADNMRNRLARIISISMGYGIYWVVCTQELSRETLGKMKNNFGQRIGFHTADKDATDLIIKGAELENIKFPGRAKIETSQGITEFQSYYIELEEVLKRI